LVIIKKCFLRLVLRFKRWMGRDCTSTIQQMIDLGGVIKFPGGVFQTTQTLVFSEENSTTISGLSLAFNNDTDCDIHIVSDAPISLENVTISGVSTGTLIGSNIEEDSWILQRMYDGRFDDPRPNQKPPPCSRCKKDKLDNFFTSSGNGRIVCPECLDEMVAIGVAHEKQLDN